ncbi:MAG TPA: hypothetical protein VM432_02455 [Bdellovibrionales bacterium]|jgi:hypothetical protein|nr:hypothetical protein [Bdellovibrionales bacterium]
MSFSGQPGRRDDCPKCGADVHACMNCRHYDPKVYNECKETSADRVQEKDRSNFCDHFSAKVLGGASAADVAKDLRSAAEALFKKK